MDAVSGTGVGNRGPSFGELNFGGVKLGDVRRVKRLVRTADRIMQRPGGTLPDKLNDPAALKGLYRLVQNEQVTHAAVLSQHQALVRQRMEVAVGDVLLIHDSTELDYTGKTTLTDLGYIGTGHRQRGYISHHSLAVLAGTGDVLGLASQILHRRPAVPEGETRRQRREKPDRESRLWQHGCAAAGPAPAEKRVIDIADRGADLFEFLDYERQQGRRYVVRSRHDRTCAMETSRGTRHGSLHTYARGLAGWGQDRVDVQGRDGKAGRTATVRIAAAEVRILPPKLPRGQHGQEPLPVWGVYVGEMDPPPHVEPLEWILLTKEPMQDLTTARERVSWYTRRWIVEEFHKAQKTGCGIELPQLTSTDRLEPVIALLSVVAVELLRLRNASRAADADTRLAAEIVPALYVEILSAWRHGVVRMGWTVREFFLAVARLGGHQNRKSDHPPGWLVLWRGWRELQSMVHGAIALQRGRCGQNNPRALCPARHRSAASGPRPSFHRISSVTPSG